MRPLLQSCHTPINNLTEPGMAEGALDQFVIDKIGTEMGFLYQDVIGNSVGVYSGEPI